MRKGLEIISGVIVPLLQALTTGLLAASLVVGISLIREEFIVWRLFWVVLAGVSLLAWLIALAFWRALVEHKPEKPPDVRPLESVRVDLARPDGDYLWVDFLDLPVSRETMSRAAAALLARDFCTSSWGGRGKALTRSQAEALRDFFIGKDLANWSRPESHTAGWSLNGAGRAVIRRFAGMAKSSPTPQARRSPQERSAPSHMQTHTDTQTRPSEGIK